MASVEDVGPAVPAGSPNASGVSKAGTAGPTGLGDRTAAAVASYERAEREEFGVAHDHFKLLGQDNFRRYLPAAAVYIRVHPDDTEFEVLARVHAARAVGSRITVSVPPG